MEQTPRSGGKASRQPLQASMTTRGRAITTWGIPRNHFRNPTRGTLFGTSDHHAGDRSPDDRAAASYRRWGVPQWHGGMARRSRSGSITVSRGSCAGPFLRRRSPLEAVVRSSRSGFAIAWRPLPGSSAWRSPRLPGCHRSLGQSHTRPETVILNWLSPVWLPPRRRRPSEERRQ